MLEKLREKVLKANLDLVKYGLVLFTWGNVSEIDRESGLVAIKPSGVEYSEMTADDILLVDLNGKVIGGNLNPSSDTPTHLELYRQFEEIGGITHTHSTYATAWAQAGEDVPYLGTTHADYFYGDIPCVRELTKDEVSKDYELNTGKVIIERFKELDPLAVPSALVKNHGVFTFGKDADNAVHNAVVCEQVAKMAYLTKTIKPNVEKAQRYLLEKHYNRKHGKDSYYGQKKE